MTALWDPPLPNLSPYLPLQRRRMSDTRHAPCGTSFVSGRRLQEIPSPEVNYETHNQDVFRFGTRCNAVGNYIRTSWRQRWRAPEPGVGAGSMKTSNETGYGSPDVTGSGARAGTGVGAAGSGPMTKRSNSSKTNGLNGGTRSGANSDVNSGPGGSRQNGQ
jgi:hypothetical protein